MDKTEIAEMARRFSEAAGISGRESSAAQVASEMLSGLGEIRAGVLGGVLCEVNAGRPGAPHLLLEAHLDRIGLMVRYLEENGFLRVGRVGGIDRRLLPASSVTIHAASGDYPGIVAAAPPHLTEGEPKPQKIEELLIDTGYPTEEAKKIFAPGDEVTMNGTFARLGEDFISGPALDDRIGCVAVICAAREIARAKPDCRVTVLLSSMEETGGQGAQTSAFALAPDYALPVDVSFGDGFGVEDWKCGKLGAGPMLTVAPVLDKAFTALVRRTAGERGIALQTEVSGGSTGTDADDIAVLRAGVRTALLGIPLRNMHTTVETVMLQDVMDTAALMAAAAEALK